MYFSVRPGKPRSDILFTQNVWLTVCLCVLGVKMGHDTTVKRRYIFGQTKSAKTERQYFYNVSIFCFSHNMVKQEPKTPQTFPLSPVNIFFGKSNPCRLHVKQRYGTDSHCGFTCTFGVQNIFIQNDAPYFGIGSEESYRYSFYRVDLMVVSCVEYALGKRPQAHVYLTNKKLIILRHITPQILVYRPHSLTHLNTIINKNGTEPLL